MPRVAGAAPAPAALVDEIAAAVGSMREARWIREHVAGDDAGARPECLELAARRASGEPLQYVLGTWPFRNLELTVDRRALVPRPETEVVVEVALAELGARRVGRVVDLGCGSGAIGLSVALESGAEVWMTEADPDAAALAAENMARVVASAPDLADRVHIGVGSWYEPLPMEWAGTVDLVVSNPPYVTEAEYAQLEPVVREWEPAGALVAPAGRRAPVEGVGGLAAIEAVVRGAGRWLAGDGVLVVEHGASQGDACRAVARAAGFASVRTERDLAGRDRMLVAAR